MEDNVSYFWDIETSTIICDNGEEMQVTYLSNVLKCDMEDGEIISSKFFRTVEETVEYFKTLDECIVWSHNLDYELSFLLRELGEAKGIYRYNKQGEVVEDVYNNTLQDVILRDKHAPLSIKLDKLPHITFRDSYAIFNKGVARLGEEIGLKKLDYDYKKVRLPWDKLEKHDYDYNERDNIIVFKSLYKYMKENNFTLKDIPLTFTSFVKKKRKEFIKENFGAKAITKFFFDKNNQYQDFSFFELMLKVYQGGWTGSVQEFTSKMIENVYSIDIKSSYPYQMCSRYFPFFEYDETTHLKGKLANDYYKVQTSKGYFGIFKFKNIQVKNRNYILPISTSQMTKGDYSSDRVTYNGKLISCSDLTLPCNNVDIDVINLVYSYDSIECLEIVATNKQRRLRDEEISFLLKAFLNKETIKDKNDIEYALSKVFINGMYGIKVTSPIRSSYTIEDGEIKEEDYFKFNNYEREDIYNRYIDSLKPFGGELDIFTDGCYITSYARLQLVEMSCLLVDMGCNVIYSDTDSIKFTLNKCSEKRVMNFLEYRNHNIIKNNCKNPRFKNFKKMFKVPIMNYLKICRLGIWELETIDSNGCPLPIPYFLTFGAKKYGYIKDDGEVVTTIAGCNKKNPPIIIKNVAKKYNIPLVDSFKLIFALGTQFDGGDEKKGMKSASGRTVAYQEKRRREDMEFLTYKGKLIKQYGGIIIKDTTYTLNVSLNDSRLLHINEVEDVVLKVNIEGDVKFE